MSQAARSYATSERAFIRANPWVNDRRRTSGKDQPPAASPCSRTRAPFKPRQSIDRNLSRGSKLANAPAKGRPRHPALSPGRDARSCRFQFQLPHKFLTLESKKLYSRV